MKEEIINEIITLCKKMHQKDELFVEIRKYLTNKFSNKSYEITNSNLYIKEIIYYEDEKKFALIIRFIEVVAYDEILHKSNLPVIYFIPIWFEPKHKQIVYDDDKAILKINDIENKIVLIKKYLKNED